MDVEITQVRTWRERQAFIELPFHLYRDDPRWVPMLRRDQHRRLRPARNPFFDHGSAALFLARQGGRAVGRVAAMVNDLHRAAYGEDVGYFGFFESTADADVAAALLQRSASWLRSRGMTVARGPIDFSMNEQCGLLAGPFDAAPAVGTAYNPPYYASLIEGCGFKVVKTLYAYEAAWDSAMPERLPRLVEAARQRSGVTLRPFDVKQRRQDTALLGQLYHSCFSRHWGLLPLPPRALQCMARDVLRFGDPQLMWIAQTAERAVGFIILLPDWNQALAKARGRLLPLGWWHVLRAARHIDRARVLAIGVDPAFRADGIDLLLGYTAYRAGLARGYRQVEMSWVLEDNHRVRRALQRIGAHVSKRYLIYDRALNG